MVWQNSNVFNLVQLFSGGSASGSALQSIGAGQTITPVSLIDISQFQSYDLTFEVNDASQGTAGHALTVSVTIDFYDDMVTGIPVYQEIWHPWVTTVKTTNVIATGPMHGHFMTISFSNPGSGPVNLQLLNLFGSPRNQQLSDWRQSHGNHVSDSALTEIPTVGNGFENSLADTNGFQALTASTNYLLPLFLYAGPCDWYWQAGPNITFNGAAIYDFGTNSVNSGGFTDPNNKIINLSVAAGTEQQGSVILPRCACALVVRVSGTGGNFSFKLVAQQGP